MSKRVKGKHEKWLFRLSLLLTFEGVILGAHYDGAFNDLWNRLSWTDEDELSRFEMRFTDEIVEAKQEAKADTTLNLIYIDMSDGFLTNSISEDMKLAGLAGLEKIREYGLLESSEIQNLRDQLNVGFRQMTATVKILTMLQIYVLSESPYVNRIGLYMFSKNKYQVFPRGLPALLITKENRAEVCNRILSMSMPSEDTKSTDFIKLLNHWTEAYNKRSKGSMTITVFSDFVQSTNPKSKSDESREFTMGLTELASKSKLSVKLVVVPEVALIGQHDYLILDQLEILSQKLHIYSAKTITNSKFELIDLFYRNSILKSPIVFKYSESISATPSFNMDFGPNLNGDQILFQLSSESSYESLNGDSGLKCFIVNAKNKRITTISKNERITTSPAALTHKYDLPKNIDLGQRIQLIYDGAERSDVLLRMRSKNDQIFYYVRLKFEEKTGLMVQIVVALNTCAALLYLFIPIFVWLGKRIIKLGKKEFVSQR